MSFRDVDPTLGGRLTDMDRQIRRLEIRAGELEGKVAALEALVGQPDAGWQLVQVGSNIRYLYVPTGTYGPVIGSQ